MTTNVPHTDWPADVYVPFAPTPAPVKLSERAQSTLEKTVRDGTAAVNAEYADMYGIPELLQAGLIERWGSHLGPRGEHMIEWVATQDGRITVIENGAPHD